VRVGLNLIYLVPGETGGMEVYARELIAALQQTHPELDLVAFINREQQAAGFDLTESIPIAVNAANRVEWVRGEQQLLPPAAKRAGVPLVHSLGSTAPWWGDFKRVTTIHDLHYRIVPDAHFGVRGLGMRVLVPGAARRSDRIIAVSQTTADDIHEMLKTPREKIDTVPQGVRPPGAVTPTPEQDLRGRFMIGDRPVLLAVSAKRPHKNLLRLVQAHGQIPAERRPMLVLPGYTTPHEAELREGAACDDVRFPAWLSPEDLEGFYAIADAFVFPSLYEGFGLPVLEAMARGVPVATSARGSLREVAGDAALLFDPEDVDAIQEAIVTLLGDERLRDELRKKGRERAAQFTWAKTAEGTVRSYERALNSTV
jgi:glycosyltransferase involved in cell wall biosynthesis